MLFLATLMGGILGVICYGYLKNFAFNLSTAIYQNYYEIFSQQIPQFTAKDIHQHSQLKPLKHNALKSHMITFAGLFYILQYTTKTFAITGLLGICFSVLYIIARIDWQYQLIMPLHCQSLLICSLIGSYFQFLPNQFEATILSAVIGRGDYWLVSALASFFDWTLLPMMVTLSCFIALTYVWLFKDKSDNANNKQLMIPFGPFLIIGATVSFFINMLT